jgi:hypothetical protein
MKVLTIALGSLLFATIGCESVHPDDGGELQLSSGLRAADQDNKTEFDAQKVERVRSQDASAKGTDAASEDCRDAIESICQLVQLSSYANNLLQPSFVNLLDRATDYAVLENCPIPACADVEVCFGPEDSRVGLDAIKADATKVDATRK